MPLAKDGALVRHGALWLTLLSLAVGGIWWAAALSGDVEDLKDEVERRRSAMAVIESLQKDVARLEGAIARIEVVLERRGDWRAKFARLEEHLRTVDARLVRLEKS